MNQSEHSCEKCLLNAVYLVDQRLKKKMKSSSGAAGDMMTQEDKWTSQIIVADVLFYQAVLTFINQDIPSYVKGRVDALCIT